METGYSGRVRKVQCNGGKLHVVGDTINYENCEKDTGIMFGLDI